MEARVHFAALVKDALEWLRQQQGSVLSTPERAAFFQPSPPAAPPPPPAVVHAPRAAPPTPPPAPSKGFKEIVARLAPQLKIQEEIPDDAAAQRAAARWQEPAPAAPVVILSFGHSGAQLSFLKQLARAIDTRLLPTKIIDGQRLEREKKWDLFLADPGLKWILAPEQELANFPALLCLYRELPATSERFLGNTPLLLLPPAARFLQHPEEKRALWNTLCRLLK
jgi:hypothetical protein